MSKPKRSPSRSKPPQPKSKPPQRKPKSSRRRRSILDEAIVLGRDVDSVRIRLSGDPPSSTSQEEPPVVPPGYEAVPFTAEIPMVPTPDGRGAVSPPLTLAGAEKEREEISRHFQRKWEAGDESALIELLHKSPRFLDEEWVREAMKERIARGLRPSQWVGRGKAGRMEREAWFPFAVFMAVEQLREGGKSEKEALYILSKQGILGQRLSWDRLKVLYLQARNSKHLPLSLRPLLFKTQS